MPNRLKPVITSAAIAFSLAAPALAHATCPPGLPPGISCGSKDVAPATAGTYDIDPAHAAVIARVSHIGYSFSIFRFDKLAGSLAWNPVAPAASKLSVTVQTGSIATNVPGLAAQLAGDGFLKSKAFPDATFVSTAFRPADATHGKVDGNFTLMGKTHPLTFDVELIGAGKGFGSPRMGVEARAEIAPGDYGLPAMFADPIELVVDAEFAQKP